MKTYYKFAILVCCGLIATGCGESSNDSTAPVLPVQQEPVFQQVQPVLELLVQLVLVLEIGFLVEFQLVLQVLLGLLLDHCRFQADLLVLVVLLERVVLQD